MGPQPDMDILPHHEGYCTRSVEVSTSRLRADFVYDVKFEVIGSPFALLSVSLLSVSLLSISLVSVSLSASKNLYIRKGSLFGVGGKAENVRLSKVPYVVQMLIFEPDSIRKNFRPTPWCPLPCIHTCIFSAL